MWPFIAAVLVIIVGLCWSEIVPSRHFAFYRNNLTQSRRALLGGFNLVFWPFETLISVKLPRGQTSVQVSHFAPGAVARFDPPCYEVQTQDRISLNVDLFIEYEICDHEYLADFGSTHDYAQILTDQTCATCNELVSRVTSDCISAYMLNDQLKEVKWLPQFGLQIKSVGIQSLKFDERMQELIRLKAMGATASEVLDCMSRTRFTDVLRSTHTNAQLLVTEPNTSNLRRI